MVKSDQSYEELIPFWLDGTIETEDLSDLKQWMHASEKNANLVHQYRTIWRLYGEHAIEEQLDVEADLKQIHHRIEKRESEQKTKIYRLPSWASFAAGAVVLVLVSFWFLNPGGQNRNMHMLADGSKIWLSEGAELVLDENFSSDHRQVTLKGKAYFEITSDPEHQFQIDMELGQVNVLGTSFVIDQPQEEIVVNVLHGLVQLKQDSIAWLLPAGTKGICTKGRITRSPQTDVNYLSWHTGEFTFDNNSIEDVLLDLSTYYGPLLLTSESDCELTATFDNEKWQTIESTIHRICGLKTRKKGNTTLFY